MVKVGQFWMHQGVDGFRLDAARHIYLNFKSQEGDLAVLHENLAWWRQFMQGVRAVNPDAYVVGEVTEKTWQQLAPWYGALSAVFDFPLATRLIEAARSEQAGDLATRLQQRYAAFAATAGQPGADAPFLSNHDQERVMSQLDGNAQHMRMAASILLTLPGHPFIYYGEELGLRGLKPDPDLREAMRWQPATDAPGETHWKALSANRAGAISVAAEQANPDSLLQLYQRLIQWRREIPALRDGIVQAWPMPERQLLAYALIDATEHVLIVHNLSGTPQAVRLTTSHAHPFTSVLRQSKTGVTLKNGQLHLPPYSTAVLQ
jgi:glycosidase